jgi:hypothetical protein
MKKNHLMKLLALAMTVVMLTAVLVGCGLLGCKTKVTVSISQETAKIAVGETLQLTATVSDGSDVEWSSSDKTVVSVTRDGLIRGAKSGTATITAKSGESIATCVVTVYSVDVTISQTEATIEKGQTLTLTAEAGDGGEIIWSSTDESIATVENGVVTALKEGKVIITAKRAQAGAATCEVTVTWTDKPEDYAVIEFGEEVNGAVANPGTYYYWNDQNWCGSSVTAIGAYYAAGVATFQYSDAAPACWHGYQVFYKHAANVAGQAYKLSAKINSLEEGEITINGTVVSLKKGENDVAVYYVEEGGKASISIQMGTQTAGTVISANTISISDVKFEEFTPEKLATPTAVSINSDRVVALQIPTARRRTLLSLTSIRTAQCFTASRSLTAESSTILLWKTALMKLRRLLSAPAHTSPLTNPVCLLHTPLQTAAFPTIWKALARQVLRLIPASGHTGPSSQALPMLNTKTARSPSTYPLRAETGTLTSSSTRILRFRQVRHTPLLWI